MMDGVGLFEEACALISAGGGANLMRGVELMRQAADAGHPSAANNFGTFLHSGRGVHKDLTGARAYYGQA
ncbi:MAG: hypothetical protein KDA39_12140, partial [Hyphomonas sp.]|nr:hypothetical protein [Hyphomonas sp.]